MSEFCRTFYEWRNLSELGEDAHQKNDAKYEQEPLRRELGGFIIDEICSLAQKVEFWDTVSDVKKFLREKQEYWQSELKERGGHWYMTQTEERMSPALDFENIQEVQKTIRNSIRNEALRIEKQKQTRREENKIKVRQAFAEWGEETAVSEMRKNQLLKFLLEECRRDSKQEAGDALANATAKVFPEHARAMGHEAGVVTGRQI